MNTTHTATSPYRSLTVRIDGEMVYAENGAFMGDVDGMTRLGWAFAPVATDVPLLNIGGHILVKCGTCGHAFYDVPGQSIHGSGVCG